MSKTVNGFPTDPKEVERFNRLIIDISDQMTKIDLIKSEIKDAKDAIKDDYDLSTSFINTLIKLYHESIADEYFEKQDSLEFAYDALFNRTGE
jgi:hypothetical protein